MVEACVCGHEAHEHHAWTGQCFGACGCSYFDDGADRPAGPIPLDHYEGIYANRKWAV